MSPSSPAGSAAAASPLTEPLLIALRELGGRATLGDLVARTALPTAVVEQAILPALSHVGGHVAVDDHGALVYTIDRTTPLPVLTPWWRRLGKATWLAFQAVFFAVLSIALVAYAVFYIALLLVLAVAAIAAAAKGSDCDCDCDCKDCGGCGNCACDASCNGCGDACYASCCARKSPDKVARRAELRESQKLARVARGLAKNLRANARRARWRNALADFKKRGLAMGFDLEPEEVSGKPPFLRAVRDFVFGPLRPPEDPAARERNLLGFIRDHQGRMTATDAAMVTGLPLDRADRVLLDLTVRVGGDVEATEDGAVVYTFDRFMVSAGADLASLEWILAQGGATTAGEFAAREGTDAADAAVRLQELARVVGGKVVHGETTVFEFPREARRRLDETAEQHAALRDFTYCWERLEKDPAILGVPAEHRGWIWGFNILNIAVSTGLCVYYLGVGERLLDTSWEVAVLGLFPLGMSLSVFLIPLARLIVEGVRNGGRRKRNAHRLALLALVHRVEQSPRVSAADLRQDLGLGAQHAEAMNAHLEQLARELEASFDLVRPDYLLFERIHRELRAVQHARDELDPRGFALEAIVYDTAEPM
ncbi:MAG: hypothetical protein IT385_11855 [Deltaproteobacteria bacterium]|nr:hypothetical protein [Deltaproteobacteria bacterium]